MVAAGRKCGWQEYERIAAELAAKNQVIVPIQVRPAAQRIQDAASTAFMAGTPGY